jgi:hypothetical protein
MKWNDHHELEGTHAFLSASKYQWLNYSNDILVERYRKSFAQDIGTIMHEAASNLIKKNTKINKQDKHLIDYIMITNCIPKTAYNTNFILNVLVPFVNDAIGFRMDSEKVLFYDYLCYGTTDAIKYSDIKKELRIHDLKTGESPASFKQLIIYAALFYLEYGISPFDNTTILRLYQNLALDDNGVKKLQEENIIIYDDYLELIPEPGIIKEVIDKIKLAVNVIRENEGKEPRQ